MIVVVMGVTGSGKTTVGRLLAEDLGWTFVDADDFHPAANVAKMHAGIPLTDEDRRPWLEALRRRLEAARDGGEDVVLACSALKHAYQHLLEAVEPQAVRCVLLTGSADLIRRRLAARTGHFMNPALLDSQFATLEPPEDAVRVDVSLTPEAAVAAARAGLGL
ncbi:gluconokinase [Paludisphaera mucosa]|uniref:Gluconokinase n=1 Tax=Paludisphaera mucosa TaxID=3030827 RepID=A0ABT6F4D7_9BACT|nr:gluconokinase [Paludisphaera mucosa]MDG3002448.1 gluconokinase [Paludisphaera mucosa]